MDKYYLFCATLLCLSSTIIIAKETDETKRLNMENKLRNELFSDTTKPHLRPVQNSNQTIQLEMALDISHIIELDEQREILSMTSWLVFAWLDLTVTWDSMQYGGIASLSVPSKYIWKPDITLLNSAKYVSDESLMANPPIWIHEDGWAFWVPRRTLHTVCPLDLRKFPFDEHECQLSFCSWTYTGLEVNVSLMYHMKESPDLAEYMLDDHNQWEIVGSTAVRQVFNAGSQYEWHFLDYYVKLRRRAPYYGLVIIVPALVAMMMTLAVFWLPPTAGEKIILGGATLLMLVLQLVQLYWVVPRNGGKVPGIVLFCGNSLIFTGISVLLSMVTLRMSRCYAHLPAPARLKNFFSGILGRILCITSSEGFLPSVKLFSGNAEVLTEERPEPSNDIEQKITLPDWVFIATALDRLFFILYCFIFVIILISSFS